MKTFREFILEASREEAEKKRLAKDNPDEWRVRNTGGGKWTTKRKSSIQGQGEKRKSAVSDLDTDLSPEERSMSKKKISSIKSRGGEHHHLTSLDQSAKEFAGLSPEQRREKRARDAQMGKYHGNDRRNIAFTSGPKTPKRASTIPHRGSGGYHSSQNKPVGSGGSVQDLGSERDIQWIRLRRERQNARRERLAKEKS